MYHFATYFDKNYLPKALLLFDSLRKLNIEFSLYVLCLDEQTFYFLEDYEERIFPTNLLELEEQVPELNVAKSNRSKIEYYFTLTSVWCYQLLSKKKEIDSLSYIDSDLYFFASPAALFEELGDQSVLIIPHNFSEKNKPLEKYGIYNVGLVCWKNNLAGLKCLKDWKTDCLTWCYDKLDGDRFADQKYLDNWPKKSEYDVHISSNHGLNAAYYNIGNRIVKIIENAIYVNNDPLIFYHYHQINQLGKYHYALNLLDEQGYSNRVIINVIYARYLKKLRKKEEELGIKSESIRHSMKKSKESFWKQLHRFSFEHNLVITPIFVIYINLESQFFVVFKTYRFLKRIFMR